MHDRIKMWKDQLTIKTFMNLDLRLAVNSTEGIDTFVTSRIAIITKITFTDKINVTCNPN